MGRTEHHRGQLIHASQSKYLTPKERSEAPERLLRLAATWREVWETMPGAFTWAKGTLQGLEPLIERAELVGDRVAWSVRFPLYGDPERLAQPCFSCREGGAVSEALPDDLAWLASVFGDCFIETDCSGSAPWGVLLGSVKNRMFDGVLDDLPPQAADWVVLYELDGDWLCADLESGRAHWTGREWTGEPDLAYPSWRPVMHFILWRLLDGGHVVPPDLDMLFAAYKPSDS
ncbi:MAG: hypothetical protein AAF715_21345 [Myxococcota bacterium]